MGKPIDPSKFDIGAEWVYRKRDDAASERVRIVKVMPTKRSARVDVEFLDADGRVENVPASRLPVLWRDVATYDASMANWNRLDDGELDDVEQDAVWHVYEKLIPEDIAECQWSPVRDATAVHKRDELEALLGAPIAEVIAEAFSFDQDGTLMVSITGTAMIAETVCRTNAATILDSIIEEEKLLRDKCKRGGQRDSYLNRGEVIDTSPEYEYDWYLKRERPRHELLRQWCGFRAVTFHERLLAAESENQRLDQLLARAIDALKKYNTFSANHLEEQHEAERITPKRARPIIDRPLKPSEIPVREIRVRQRRWW